MRVVFVDSGVLIAAARGKQDVSAAAMAVLDDPDAAFASSEFVRLEVLPKPTHFRLESERQFYVAFFGGVAREPASVKGLMKLGWARAVQFGLSALDSLHVAAAEITASDELITTEKPGQAIHRATSIPVRYAGNSQGA